ncbi:MAG: hypothetical protein WKF52_08920 [Sphingomicrobium sp.]
MALSNSERQARYRQRLKDAAQGVTPEMVVAAARIIFEVAAEENPSIGNWQDFLIKSRQKRYRTNWEEMVPDDPRPNAYWFLEGDDRRLVESVAAVINAATVPPAG